MGIEKATDVDLKKDTKIVGTSFDASSVQKQNKATEDAKKEADVAKTKMEEEYSFLKGDETLSDDKLNILFDTVNSLIKDIKAGKLVIEEDHKDAPFYLYAKPNKYHTNPQNIYAHVKGANDFDLIEYNKYTRTREDTTYMNDLYKQWESTGTIVKQSPQEIKESLKKGKEKYMSDKVQWLINDIKSGKQEIESKYRETPFYFYPQAETKTIKAHIKNQGDYDFMVDGFGGYNAALKSTSLHKYTWTPEDVVYMNNLYWQKRAKQM